MCEGTAAQPCSVKNLEITQTATGKTVKNKAEWNVTVTNNCICSQLNVKLNCKGFETVEAPSVVSISGDTCVFNDKVPVIFGFESVSFTYAWDAKFAFKPVFSVIACS
ncbi:hypothetical protein ACJIZ3_025723 [Penstemon smallii]|uniref:Uncharacterized protein n=1 Tax=Penstemon smallii TaxID=265156 RepID=A0ABD3TY34_9LAMI